MEKHIVFLIAKGVLPQNPVYGSAEKNLFTKYFSSVTMNSEKVEGKNGFKVTCLENENGALARFKADLEKQELELKSLSESEVRIYQVIRKN